MAEAKPPRKLSLFDVTNLVIGAIIGADIYVASSFGAGYLGPFSLIVGWSLWLAEWISLKFTANSRRPTFQ